MKQQKNSGSKNSRTSSGENRPSRKITSKQVVALAGVALLVLLYLGALVAAITDNSGSGRWFMGCIFGTVAIPVFIWVYTWLYGKLTGKHTIADASRDGSETPRLAEDPADDPGNSPAGKP